MGQSGSTAGGGVGSTEDGENPRDLYEVLNVSTSATEDEIKKSYVLLLHKSNIIFDDVIASFRRLALQYHPDKNPDDIAGSTKKFAELQRAYEVLSDPNERAWYDRNKEELLRGPAQREQDDDIEQELRRGPDTSESKASSPGTSAKQILRFFDASKWKAFDDSPKGFYSLYSALFQRLACEEAYPLSTSLPSFGTTDTPYIPHVSSFYSSWSNISTTKSFSWREQYSLATAPDRRVRRLMEKENKRLRDEGRREYNEVIRSLVSWLRKRDPRVKEWDDQGGRERAKEEEDKRRKLEKEDRAKKLAKEREALAKSYREPEWMKTSQIGEGIWNAADEWSSEEDEEENEVEGEEDDPELFCVACNKRFATEASWMNHERSKKHIKNVKRIQREMLDENEKLGLDEGTTPRDDGNEEGENDMDEASARQKLIDEITASLEATQSPSHGSTPNDVSGVSTPTAKGRKGKRKTKPQDVLVVNEQEEEDFVIPKGMVTKNKKGKKKGFSQLSLPVEDEVQPTAETMKDETLNDVNAKETEEEKEKVEVIEQLPQQSKRDKRRAREAAKKAAADATKGQPERCNVCKEEFNSRTKLFAHVKETGHASADQQQAEEKIAMKTGGRKGKRT